MRNLQHPSRIQTHTHWRAARTAAATIAALTVTAATAGGAVAAPPQPSPACPALYVLGVQPPGEVPPATPPEHDAGLLGQVFAPLLAGPQKQRIRRAYIPYQQPATPPAAPAGAAQAAPAAPGTPTPGAPTPGVSPGPGAAVEAAVAAATAELTQAATGMLGRCPDTMLAVAGYAEGARVADRFARAAGAGQAGDNIPADRVAAVALFADPARPAGAPVLPGRAAQTTPDAPPALAAHAPRTRAITFTGQRPPGGGVTAIAAPSAGAAEYGQLAGRVASFCAPGDLSCDAPAHGALLQVVNNIAQRANLADPLAAIGAIAGSLASTLANTAITVFSEDVTGNRLPALDYTPQQTLSQRLAAASNPAVPQPGVADVVLALLRAGLIGVDAATTIAKGVLTPDTMAAMTAAGAASPAAAAAVLGARMATAGMTLIPPDAPDRLLRIAFDTVTALVSDNRDLFDLSVLAKYSGSIGRRQTYTSSPATPDGKPAATATTDWFTALAADIAAAPRTPAPEPDPGAGRLQTPAER